MDPEERAEIVAKIAEQVWGHYDADFVSRALEHVERGLAKYDPTKGGFSSWCWTVVYNLRRQRLREIRRETAVLTDVWKKGKEGAGRPASYDEARADWDQMARAWRSRLEKIQQVLHDLRGDFQTAREQVNYYAVVLMRMRRITIHCLVGALSPEEVAELAAMGTVAGRIECLLSWDGDDGHLAFRNGLPPIATIWEALRTAVNATPYCFDVGHLCNNVNQLGGATLLSDAQWSKWVERAKNRLRDKVGESVWGECFAAFFPD